MDSSTKGQKLFLILFRNYILSCFFTYLVGLSNFEIPIHQVYCFSLK